MEGHTSPFATEYISLYIIYGDTSSSELLKKRRRRIILSFRRSIFAPNRAIYLVYFSIYYIDLWGYFFVGIAKKNKTTKNNNLIISTKYLCSKSELFMLYFIEVYIAGLSSLTDLYYIVRHFIQRYEIDEEQASSIRLLNDEEEEVQ